MNLSVEFLGGPNDRWHRWHRWTVVEAVRDALIVASELLWAKGVHVVAMRETNDAAAPHWRVRS